MEEEPEPTVTGMDEDGEGWVGQATSSGKRKRIPFAVAPQLAKELAAFTLFRTSEIRRERNGKKVMPITAACD